MVHVVLGNIFEFELSAPDRRMEIVPCVLSYLTLLILVAIYSAICIKHELKCLFNGLNNYEIVYIEKSTKLVPGV